METTHNEGDIAVKRKSENISIIDSGLTIDGSISCKGKLIIKGTVKGSLEGETVVVADEGKLYAEAEAASVTIGGIFQGSIRASKELVILASGNCSGRVVCKDLVVEAGGILNAEVTCTAGADSIEDKSSNVKALEF
jgi:cytoskeletal protein CcmA (bactofilin family)